MPAYCLKKRQGRHKAVKAHPPRRVGFNKVCIIVNEKGIEWHGPWLLAFPIPSEWSYLTLPTEDALNGMIMRDGCFLGGWLTSKERRHEVISLSVKDRCISMYINHLGQQSHSDWFWPRPLGFLTQNHWTKAQTVLDPYAHGPDKVEEWKRGRRKFATCSTEVTLKQKAKKIIVLSCTSTLILSSSFRYKLVDLKKQNKTKKRKVMVTNGHQVPELHPCLRPRTPSFLWKLGKKLLKPNVSPGLVIITSETFINYRRCEVTPYGLT